MKTTIDAAGRIVIPKEMRKRAGLLPGAEVEVRCQDGIIEIQLSSSVRLVQKGPFLVAVVEGAPLMTEEEANHLVNEERDARMRAVLGQQDEQ
jgi:AbrB family looped-hinge helix DNA binding protein